MKEARRVFVMEQLVAGKVTATQAAKILQLSVRQIKRLKVAFRDGGPSALAHKSRGNKPVNALPEAARGMIRELAVTSYARASCGHMAELLEERQGLKVSPKTVSRVLHEAGLGLSRTYRQKKRHRSRKRKPQLGMMVQMDASPFSWFEDRGPEASLHGAIDDATSRVLALHFEPQECTLGYLHILRQMLLDYGVPLSCYSDGHAIFAPTNGQPTLQEELAGKTAPVSQLGQILLELGVTAIRARSPQARGRVERLWETLQSRLMVELRLAGISTVAQANSFLPAFIERHNTLFAVEPSEPVSVFRPAPSPEELHNILAFREFRVADSGSAISFMGQTYQLAAASGRIAALHPKSEVKILTHMDGSRTAWCDGQVHTLVPFTKPMPQKSPPAPRKPSTYKPAPDHPWRRYYSKRKPAAD